MAKLTTMALRGGGTPMQHTFLMSGEYDIAREYVGSQSEHHYMAGCLVALGDDGLLVPPWAFDAGDAAGFAEKFVGYADQSPNGKQKEVNVIIFGGRLHAAQESPKAWLPHSAFTVADNPVETINADGTKSNKLHGWLVRAAASNDESIFRVCNPLTRHLGDASVYLALRSRTFFGPDTAELGGPAGYEKRK